MPSGPSSRSEMEIELSKLSSPRIFLVRMLVFLVLCALVMVVLYKQIITAFFANPGLNALIGGVLLIGMGLGLRYATRWVVEPTGGPPDHVYRRDVVRALAEGEHDGGAAKKDEPARSADAMDR